MSKPEAIPTLNRTIQSKDRAYRLEFRHKNRYGISSGVIKEKVFWFQGNLKEAVQRIRIHCERMDYTYIRCSPFIVDLEAQEEMKDKDTEGAREEEY